MTRGATHRGIMEKKYNGKYNGKTKFNRRDRSGDRGAGRPDDESLVCGRNAVKELLADIKYEKIELLPFRKLCTQKYKSLGIEFPLKDTPECSKETLNKLKALL